MTGDLLFYVKFAYELTSDQLKEIEETMLNRHEIIGRLGKAPEVRTLENGKKLATFSVATTDKYKDKTTGELKETTEWHKVVMWNKLADISAEFLHKGSLVYICGKSKTRSYEKDGVTKYITELKGSEISMLSPKDIKAGIGDAGKTVSEDGVDDLPF